MSLQAKIFLTAIVILGAILLFFLVDQGLQSWPSNLEEDIPEEEYTSEEVVYSSDFSETINQIDSPEQLVNFLNQNFKLVPREGIAVLTPLEFFDQRQGGEQDFARFTSHVLRQQGFVTIVFAYQYVDQNQIDRVGYVSVFRDGDEPKHIYFDQEKVQMASHGWSYEDLCQYEEERRGIDIVSYGVISLQATEMVPEEWIKL